MALGMHPASLYPRRSRVAPYIYKVGRDVCSLWCPFILGVRQRAVKPFCTLKLYNVTGVPVAAGREIDCMTFDDQLKRAFETLTIQLHDDFSRHVQTVIDELA